LTVIKRRLGLVYSRTHGWEKEITSGTPPRVDGNGCVQQAPTAALNQFHFKLHLAGNRDSSTYGEVIGFGRGKACKKLLSFQLS
jgi:hypothetical protein